MIIIPSRPEWPAARVPQVWANEQQAHRYRPVQLLNASVLPTETGVFTQRNIQTKNTETSVLLELVQY